jgi:diguanylate cyclase (GGDEF)-like protein
MTSNPTSEKRGSETTSRQDFQISLEVLDGITSRHAWSSAQLILLLPVMMALLSLPLLIPHLAVFKNAASELVGALLGLMWVVGAFMLSHQRRDLRLLRKGLIEQTDAATRNRVKGEQLYGLSILDPLTGLYNRRFGEDRLKEEIARALQSKDPLLVLALDFDRFKPINDQYGHAAGDLALKEFSRRLQRAIRACDVPIRVGGDEFLVIFPDCPREMVDVILSRMGTIVLRFEGHEIPVNFSHGLAQYEINDTPATMVHRADKRLYAAKAKRKDAEREEQTLTEQSATAASEPAPRFAEPTGSDRQAGTSGAHRTSQIPDGMSVEEISAPLA